MDRFFPVFIGEIPKVFSLQMGHAFVIDIYAVHVVDVKIAVRGIELAIFPEIFQTFQTLS